MHTKRFFAIVAGTALLGLAGRPASPQPCTPPACNSPAPSQWIAGGVPVSTANGPQAHSIIGADGQGGALMAWYDARESVPRVYVQRVHATGQILWCRDGLPIDYCGPNTVGQLFWNLQPTGDGGAIFSWTNNNNLSGDVYAQRLSETGFKLWGEAGIPISNNPATSRSGLVSTLGQGGYTFLAWSDPRSPNGSDHIFAQKINTTTGAAQWASNGIQVSAISYLPGSTYPSIVDDGEGGFVVVWKIAHNLDDGQIHAQRIGPNGNRLWGPSDVVVCDHLGSVQQSPRVVKSTNGSGAVQFNVIWTDDRLGSLDIFGQALNSAGQRLWATAGVPLITGAENQFGEAVPDGDGGILLGWFTQYASDGVWMRRFDSSGASVWPFPLQVFTGWAQNVHLTPNGTNGALVTWDNALVGGNAYVQGVRNDQLLTWGVGGVALSNRPEAEAEAVACSDGDGGAIVSWQVGAPTTSDIYVTRVTKPPPGGGGHCPFLDTWSAGSWQEENSILGRSATGEMQRDLYKLSFSPDVGPDGMVRLRVREDEQERTRLAQARLLAVDRNADQMSWVRDGRVVLGTRVPVVRVTSSTGEDLTARLSDPAGKGLDCAPGTILDVQLYDRTAPEAGLVKFDLAGLLVRPSKKEIGNNPSRDDGEILRNSGILVQKPDGNGGWIELARIRPREKASDLGVDAARELRLVFVGQHRIHSLAWVRLDPNVPAFAELRAASAMHSVAGEVSARISGRAGEVTLSPGERIEIAFQVPEVPAGKVRDYYFEARGVYTSVSDAAPGLAGVPRQIELYAANPNPAAGSVRLAFGLPSAARVRISIFDVAGRLVSRPVDGPFEAGRHDATWDLTNGRARVPTGMYLYRMEVGGWHQERKLIVK